MPTMSPQQRHFRRGYVACALCRAHKVRCVLGSEPPCAKCRREHRQCVFDGPKRGPRTRGAPRWATGESTTGSHEQQESQQATDTNSTINHSSTTASQGCGCDDTASAPRGSRPGLANAQRNPCNDVPPHLQVPAHSPTSLLERAICPNETPAFLDALSTASQGDGSAVSATLSLPPLHPNLHKPVECDGKLRHPPIIHELSRVDDAALLGVWSQIPFVQLGWFTAQEALTYFDLFYRHLAPFCLVFDMKEVEVGGPRHAQIAQEPMLCTTIFMIASRFFTLPGPGALDRGYLIHHRLWQQCERLIQLLMYGQERHLRGSHTLGTIQSLLLLSEWHPLSLRSPLPCPSQNDVWGGREGLSEGLEQTNPAGFEKDLLDRAKQSDRFSWMMVGQALNLAHEAGVFSDTSRPNDVEGSEWLGPLHTRKLLYVYVTNLSVRLGFQNTFTQDVILTRAILPHDAFYRHEGTSCDLAMELWLGLVRLHRAASVMFFQSSSNTKAHLRNGEYIILLQTFSVTLSKWYDDFVASQSDVDQNIEKLLLIEYHNLKTYTHALAIQAILERTRSQNFPCLRKDQLELLSTCYLPEDFDFIHQVQCSSNTILQTAVDMAVDGRLRFIPIRQLRCILSAFLFLFKALSICTNRKDVQSSLFALDRCAKALLESDMDEMDVSRDTLEFLHSHVRKLGHGVNLLFSLSDQGQALDAQAMSADPGESPAVDATTASQPLPLGVNWNQDMFTMVDLAIPWYENV